MKPRDLAAWLGAALRRGEVPAPAAPDAQVRVVSTTAEIDEMLQRCERAAGVSDDALRAVFREFRMVPPTDVPADPFSADYRAYQLALYEKIAGKAYSPANEQSPFDLEAAVSRPFPYATASGKTVGEHYMAIGFLIRVMALPPGSRILEFGPGWGNLTIALAKMGHHVTAVDIEPRFCELIRRRAERDGLPIEVINGDFFWPGLLERQYDAIVFFECFHHCDDHVRLLERIHDAIAPNAKLVFGAEPVSPEFAWPWGLRLDGESLWAIRRNGWLELGFHEDYFKSLLKRTGWIGSQAASDDIPWMKVWNAIRREDRVSKLTFDADDRRLKTKTGTRTAAMIEFTGRSGTGLYGPYVPLPSGRYVARLRFSSEPVIGAAMMDVCAGRAHRQIGCTPVRAGALLGNAASLDFQFAEDTEDVEVRLFCRSGFKAQLLSVEIEFLEE